MSSTNLPNDTPPKSQLLLGGVIFVLGFMSPLLIPLVTNLDLSTEWKTAISGALLFGIPEVFMLIAIAILGKQGFDYLKSYLWQAIRPDDTVSARRFRIGLLLFFIPLVYAWLSPYMELWITGMDAFRMHLAVTGDVIFAISLFVLGGDFWLKLKNLFTHD